MFDPYIVIYLISVLQSLTVHAGFMYISSKFKDRIFMPGGSGFQLKVEQVASNLK